jgi:hypothetical protein
LFVAGLATAAVVAPQTALNFVGNLGGEPLGGVAGILGTGLGVLTFFVTPLIVAGAVGMAREAVADGATSVDTFLRVARERYVSLLLAFLVRVGITVALGILAAIVFLLGTVVFFFVVGLGGAAAAPGADPGALFGAVGVVGVVLVVVVVLVAALLFYGPLFFIQLFYVAVAADGAGAIDGFRRSIRVVRENLLSTLGFWAVRTTVGLLSGAPVAVFAGLRLRQRVQSPGVTPAGEPLFSTVEVVGITLAVLAVQVVVVPFQHTYATAFYGAAGGWTDDAEAGDTGEPTDADDAFGADETDAFGGTDGFGADDGPR